MVSYDIRSFFHTRWIWFATPKDISGVDEVAFLSYDDVPAPTFRKKKGLTTIIDLSLSEENLWENLRASFIRKQIKRGEARNLSVREGVLSEFLPLYGTFRSHKGFEGGDVKSLTDGRVYVVEGNGQILSGGLFLDDGVHVRAFALASVRLESLEGSFRELVGYANRMLLWNAIQIYKAAGCQYLDLGGIAPDSKNTQEKTLAEFKEAFGGTRSEYYFYRKTYSSWLRLSRRLRANLFSSL